MRILFEDTMPYAGHFFDDLGDSQSFSGKTLTADDVAGANALLVRSTTQVDQALIGEATDLSFVATATAGYDHLDTVYLAQRDIPYYVASGCNAVAVAEYILSVLAATTERMQWDWTEKVVGIVGAGQVGSALAKRLNALGVQYKLCDPPLAQQGDHRVLVGMDEIMACDIITLHTPWVCDGPFPTHHLFDEQRLGELTEKQLLINACRGEVIDNQALLAALETRALNVVLDVWENEPDIDLRLLSHLLLATPHIAGHSVEGKANGTLMVYKAFAQQFNLDATKGLQQLLPEPAKSVIELGSKTGLSALNRAILAAYDVRVDDANFRQSVTDAEMFIHSRKHYPVRREFLAFSVKAGRKDDTDKLAAIGFGKIN